MAADNEQLGFEFNEENDEDENEEIIVDDLIEEDNEIMLAESNGDIVPIDTLDTDIVDVSKDVDRTNSFYACFRNDLITAKQTSTIREAKLLRIVISQILQDATDFKSYKIKVTDLAKILDLDSSSLYRDARKLCEGLHKRFLSIDKGNGEWETLSWISRSYYKDSYIHICLSSDLKPYLLQLKKDFTKIQVQEFVKFSSFYGLRVYECLKSEWKRHRMKQTKFKFDVSVLRAILDGENKLKTFSHLKQRALIPAIEAINNNDATQFTVEMETISGHKKAVTAVVFKITPRNIESKENEEIVAALSIF